MSISIAIDGPSGAGKSTVADELAAKLGILHLDTGAMYRAFAWRALAAGVDSLDEAALSGLAKDTEITVAYEDGKQRTLVNGEDVTELIRTPEISMAASNVSKFGEVRRFMVKRQQELAQTQSMILDGRDIGTKVLPDATLKVFLTASAEVRARRRFEELQAKGEAVSYAEVLEDVQRRDLQDSTREIDPLRPAEDAVIVDTSNMMQAQAVEAIGALIEPKVESMLGQTKPAKPEKERFSWTYRAAVWLSGALFCTLFPIRYHHAQRALIEAPFILIANHNSMMDPLVAGWKCRDYQLRFLGKKELVKNPVLKALFTNMRMIPVDRHNMDMTAVRACLKTLKEGHPLGIFPEGTRHKQGVMQDLESGVAMIALRSGAPMLPVYITGKPQWFRAVHCYYGEPIPTAQWAKDGIGKENCEALLAAIRQVYAELVAEHAAQGTHM